MTKKDYISIADIFVKALDKADTRGFEDNLVLTPELLAIIEDFMTLFKADSSKFDKKTFVKYINGRRKSGFELLINY